MSADEAALCEAAYRAQTAANLDARSAVEAAVEAAEKEASEFVEENATEYRKLKVPFARKYKKFAKKTKLLKRLFCRQAETEELQRSQSAALEEGGYSSLEALRSEAEQLKADVERLEDDLRPHIGMNQHMHEFCFSSDHSLFMLQSRWRATSTPSHL